jgi:hypothetical protein
MKIGDIVMIYTAPVTRRVPSGKAKLIEFLEDYGVCEYWRVQYVDNNEIGDVLIRKEDEKQ